jgi:hypothetical protein
MTPKHEDEAGVLVGEAGVQDVDCCEVLYGHGILWAAAALIHVLRQRSRYEIGDFSKAILLAPEGQMGRANAAAPVKGAPAPRDEIQEAVDKFVESASKSERIISEVCPHLLRFILNWFDAERCLLLDVSNGYCEFDI